MLTRIRLKCGVICVIYYSRQPLIEPASLASPAGEPPKWRLRLKFCTLSQAVAAVFYVV